MQHALNWFEIPCAQIDRAQAFYERLLGAALVRENYGGPGMEMAVFPADGEEAVRGALQAGPGAARPGEGGTLGYLNAGPSIDAVLARVQPAGGRIHTPKTALPPGLGFFAHIIDTEGNRVGLHAPA
ncbi:VOC family protein [Variovorax terrae]|uniref:VOC family protein n=1 Tax=Variovorax terrae TaxID=2923278 RepID=A0A9X2ARB3_9BURK|nr:VOC family protein [Variovorax terrae]MCJ0765472.1 VOC family protein [Variovorax terrae]